MANARRGEVWQIDFGLAAKVRPALVLGCDIAEESRTAVGFTPLLFYAADNLHDLVHRLRAGRALPLEDVELSTEIGPLLFLLSPDEVSHHIAGGGEASLLLARLEPGQLAWGQGNIQRFCDDGNVFRLKQVGKIRQR